MSLPTIRTITLGLEQPHPLSGTMLAHAAEILRQARVSYQDAGYEVQTVRVATRPFLDDLKDWPAARILSYGQELQRHLDELGLEYCSLGTVFANHPDFALERLDLIADLLIGTTVLNATVHLATPEQGLRYEAAQPIARIMQRLARETEQGFGNFRFAMLACVPPGGPFFPTAYHSGASRLSIGLQGAHLVLEAVEGVAGYQDQPLPPAMITARVRDLLSERAAPVVALGQRIARERGIEFGGIDLSPAPMGDVSIVRALEACGYGALGSAGTLTIVGAITAALKSVQLPLCGYNGLMLPVLEDVILGKRWEEGRVNVQQLLLYSAVCGTGLDTIPLPGASSVESIAQLLLDVATLGLRYQKPLSARLFPVPGRQDGEYTQFTSPYLTNTRIRAL